MTRRTTDYECADQRKRPWLYAQDFRTDEDLRRLGIPKPGLSSSLWRTMILAIILGAMLAWMTRGHLADPIAQAVGEMIRRLWS